MGFHSGFPLVAPNDLGESGGGFLGQIVPFVATPCWVRELDGEKLFLFGGHLLLVPLGEEEAEASPILASNFYVDH